MIQLQDMLLQTDGDKIYVLPCWPKDVDVSFRLYASQNTVVDCCYQDGKIKKIDVTPIQREKDIVVLI